MAGTGFGFSRYNQHLESIGVGKTISLNDCCLFEWVIGKWVILQNIFNERIFIKAFFLSEIQTNLFNLELLVHFPPRVSIHGIIWGMISFGRQVFLGSFHVTLKTCPPMVHKNLKEIPIRDPRPHPQGEFKPKSTDGRRPRRFPPCRMSGMLNLCLLLISGPLIQK